MYLIWTYFCKNAKKECVAVYTHRHTDTCILIQIKRKRTEHTRWLTVVI